MNRIFNPENRFFSGLNKIIDAFYIALLFIFSCIPVFTIGAALSALYYTVHKPLIHNRGYIWSTYWDAFKSNFKNSTITWLIQLLITVLMCVDLYVTYQMQKSGSMWGGLFFVFLMFLLLSQTLGLYCYGYMARFDQERKAACKNALLIGIANMGWTFLLTGILLAVFVVLFIIPILLLVVVAIVEVPCYLILEHVFKKYMRPEDLEREMEENRYDY